MRQAFSIIFKKMLRKSISFAALALFAAMIFLNSCKQKETTEISEAKTDSVFNRFLENYYNGKSRLFPMMASLNGNSDFNDLLEADFTDSYREKSYKFFQAYLDSLKTFDRNKLNFNDRISYDLLKDEIDLEMEDLTYNGNYLPVNQFFSLPQYFGQAGSGTGFQPFNTIKDYDNWLKRADGFVTWTDSAIIYLRKGIAEKVVLPKSLVVKVIPQLEAMVVSDPAKSLFYGPVTNIPASFSKEDAAKYKRLYEKAIAEKITPSYRKLAVFMKDEYLPAARTTSGINAIPNGDAYYKFLVKVQTTTSGTPDEIYNIGLAEVKRILAQMDSVKDAVGFEGDRKAFFEYLRTAKKFTPYKTPKEVLDAFEDIHQRMKPELKTMFTVVPKSRFEIRQTEAFRAASASAEYNSGTIDGSRPGIFYVPIIDATQFNTSSGMESLFLHEAIPGHHYQLSLQMEDTLLPKFRRYGGNNAYVEGWALYCESLGKELGLYKDPYQYMGALGDEIHRAIRLVVDVGLHSKNMTREEAIAYMMDNEAISEQGATAEIERYMAMPAQALGYKIGALKIRELRNKYEKQLGDKFSVAEFHGQVLKYGALPLDLLEKVMDERQVSSKK
ncbi:DUF885 domain-containing protein [Pollutibacter soli]|uniref:DUF885 domain-containing protein n=1 Tax=Pollutibacter soli TaxID=3034157 RepID=UPI0030135FF1